MSDNLPPRRRSSLVLPLVLAVAGVAVLGVAASLTRSSPPPPPPPPGPMAAVPAPAPPDVPVIRPSFDIVRVSPFGDAVLAGRAAPNADVTVTSNGVDIGHVQADAAGQFVFLPKTPLAPGGQELALATPAADGGQIKGDAPVLLLVPERSKPGSAPSATAPAAAIAVLTPQDSAPRVLQGPQPPSGTKLGLAIVDYAPTGAMRFGGTAPPQSQVRLSIDDVERAEGRADGEGRWTLAPTGDISAGPHRLRLEQLSAAGAVVDRQELPFQRAAMTAQDLPADRIIVQPAQNLWRIARHAYGQGVRYTDIYQANRDQIHDPNLIYPGQIFSVPLASPSPSASSASR